MSKLTEWLESLESVIAAVEITLYLDGKRYEGASYVDSNFGDKERLYFLGELPPSYKRSTRTAYVIDRADWYVACYMPADRITDENRKFHPFGETFMLCRWSVPDGTPIDYYEPRPYNRIPALVRPGADLESGVNLDCYGDDLMAFWNRYQTRSRHRASELFPNRPAGYVRAARNLAAYASNKATAIQCRARGDVETALGHESICQRIYDRLPLFARW